MSIIEKDLEEHGNRYWQVTTQPSLEPITLDEVKTYARIDGTDEDTLLTGFITAVRQYAETYLGRAFVSQTITLTMDWWPGVVIKLPRPPLISITSVATLDEDDTATTYSSSNYYTNTRAEPGLLILKQGVTHPYNTARDYGGYRIIFLAGYGAPNDVPQAIREAIKMWVTECYEYRAVEAEPRSKRIMNLLSPYKVARINY